MKLEDEIQQKKFKSEYQKLAVNLSYTYNWYSYKNHEHFKNFDVTPQQFNVLRILRGQYPNPCNLKLIKERMLDRVSDASRIIDKLKNKELVQRRECADDRRNVDLLITAKGLELLKSLDFIDEEHKNTFRNLSLAEIKILNDLLDKLRT
ncbi:MAG: MarR family winged helix-turn-helix transcriptional regulator [Bacteroidia bacterium]